MFNLFSFIALPESDAKHNEQDIANQIGQHIQSQGWEWNPADGFNEDSSEID